ncbi:uncharacterized protein LOC108908165 [Anoplophora glabripennis]|uniref:uncharacterized protein LOC108908165 n=1 Tax=Anoplophora glabripennis TaxID=217634 RepID=UPI0008758994|nr:uncharacterized protein LOC108908165 [Anoplophora glabripennis]
MDDNENTEFIEVEMDEMEIDKKRRSSVEMDFDKKRRSSILKPQKTRNPLSTLDFSEANPDTTLARATRRVSFASSNFVKPFAADPEKNTIWDTTYEEEVNHTDSSKSPSDQTHKTKAFDFLHTFIYSEIQQNEHNPANIASSNAECVNADAGKAQADVMNPGESLVSFARKLRNKSKNEHNPADIASLNTECVNADAVKAQADVMNSGESLVSFARKLRTKSVGIETMINKTTEFLTTSEADKDAKLQENTSIISPFYKIKNISCSTTKLSENTMEMTCLTDKENVNPLINDLSSLVVSKRNCFEATSATKYFVEEKMDCTISVKSNEKAVYFDKSENKHDFTGLDANKENGAIGKNVCTIQNSEQNKEELHRNASKNATVDVEMRTICFNDSMNGMELTNMDKSGHSEEKGFSTNTSNRKKILFNETEGNMDFTCVINKDEQNIEARTENEMELKNKTVIFNQSDNDMEFTTTIPVKIYNNNLNKQKTICFDDSGEEMEFTETFQNPKILVKDADLNTDVCFEKSEYNMEFTTTLVGKIHNTVDSTISQADDMNLTTALSTQPIEKEFVEAEIDKTKSEMSLTKNLQMVNLVSNIPTLIENNNSGVADCKKKICLDEFKNVNQSSAGTDNTINVITLDAVRCNSLSINKEDVSSNSPLTNNCTLNKQILPQINKNKTRNHQGIGNDNSTLSVSLDTSDINKHTDFVDGNNSKTFMPNPALPAHLNLNDTSNLDHIRTPTTSFHINWPTMSPCTEDTQQLIHASFSKPETLKMLNGGIKRNIDGLDKTKNVSKSEESPFEKSATVSPTKMSSCQGADSLVKINENIFVENVKKNLDSVNNSPHHALGVSEEKLDVKFIKMSNESLKTNKSCFLEDVTPLELVPEEFDHSRAEIKSPNQSNIAAELDNSLKNISSSRASNCGDYTLRSQLVLEDIEKRLLVYKPNRPQMNLDMPKLIKQFKKNSRKISEMCKSKVHIMTFEEKRKQDIEEERKQNSEESLCSGNEDIASTEVDPRAPPSLAVVAPKTIYECIREMAERAKKYWEFVKLECDYCYFYTLFGTLPFKVHIHPELGMVYSVETFTNLSDLCESLCWYQLKLFQQKLKYENLLSVLGAKFDIFALLDYICLSMEEISDFHNEYISLVKKYGKSHHFRMNSDYSITFEILNQEQIIFWIITVKMSLTSLVSVSKEDITVVHKVGKKVSEEHIKMIAENTPKGLNFLRNFIENVDEFVTRIGRRLKK